MSREKKGKGIIDASSSKMDSPSRSNIQLTRNQDPFESSSSALLSPDPGHGHQTRSAIEMHTEMKNECYASELSLRGHSPEPPNIINPEDTGRSKRDLVIHIGFSYASELNLRVDSPEPPNIINAEGTRSKRDLVIHIGEPSSTPIDGQKTLSNNGGWTKYFTLAREMPNSDMIDGISAGHRKQYVNQCVPLYQAALTGDWKKAEALIEKNCDLVRVAITNRLETVLHIAAAAKQTAFVKKLVKRMEKSDLALKNIDGNTAICFAASSGVVDIAKAMVDRNKDLPLIRSNNGMTPRHMAVLFGNREMVSYLKEKTPVTSLSPEENVKFFLATISANMYDVALDMLKVDESLAICRNPDVSGELPDGDTALHLMARKTLAIANGTTLGFFQRWINFYFEGLFHKAMMRKIAHQLVDKLWKQLLIEKHSHHAMSEFIKVPSRLLFDAAASGNIEFLVILIRSYPDLIWKVDDNNLSLFHIAALNRHSSIFNIINEIGAIKDIIAAYKDNAGNNMLHLVATQPPLHKLQTVSGAALQMQSELLWFKAVKKIVPPSYKKMRNSKGKLPREVFTETHTELRKLGEKWMKDTSASCMLAATLIATVVFAAAFTVPGGNNNDKGTPILQRDKLFTIFVLSDAIALFCSSISIVFFLSILTSHFAESDFQFSLPSRLMIGLLTLFLSIITMVVAFSVTLFLIYNHEFSWIPIMIISLASVTALSFASLHAQIWFDAIRSTISSNFLFQIHKPRLYS